MSAANGHGMTARRKAVIPLQIGTLHVKVPFLIVKEIRMEILICNDQLQAWKAKINFEEEMVEIGPGNLMLIQIWKEAEEGKIQVCHGIKLEP